MFSWFKLEMGIDYIAVLNIVIINVFQKLHYCDFRYRSS